MGKRYHRCVSTVRELREAAGLSQRELAAATGIAQPNIAAYESGRRTTSATILDRVRQATDTRPSARLRRHQAEVLRIVKATGARQLWVFGSVARGTDEPGSDLDLVVEFGPGSSLLTQSQLQLDLEKVLGVRVDVISSGALTDRFGERVRAEMVALA